MLIATVTTPPALIITTEMPSNMPWERVRGDVLRTLVKELGLKSYGLNREAMVELLEAVERDGIDAVLEQQEGPSKGPSSVRAKRPRTSQAGREPVSQSAPPKRAPARPRKSRRFRATPSFQVLRPTVEFDCVLIPPTSFKTKGKGKAPEPRSSETPRPSDDDDDEAVFEEVTKAVESTEEDTREEELQRGRQFRGRVKTYKSRRSHSRRSEQSTSSIAV